MTHRPGTVLFAVLFLIVLAALSAMAMLGAAEAERATSSRQQDELQLHAAVRSALLVYAAEFDAQRDTLSRGGSPEMPETIEISRGESGPPVRITILPASDGRLVTSEAERLDLNSANAEMLAALPGVGPRAADRLIAMRDTSRFDSPNIAASALHDGSPPVIGAAGQVSGPERASNGPDPLDLLSVFAADPQTQIGVAGPEYAGNARVSLAGLWSDSTERAFQSLASERVAAAASAIFINAPRLTKPSDFVRLLIAQAVPTDQWAGLLDSVTLTNDPYILGLIDINRAPRAVLAALPGLDDQTVTDLISARDRLEPEDRLAITWPLDQGVIEQDRYALLVDHITTRSLQWRLTFRVSIADEDARSADTADSQLALDPFDVDLVGQADEFGVPIDDSADPDAARTEPGPVYEAVFDAAGNRTRIAYLRERTAIPLIETLLAAGLLGGADQADDAFAEAGATGGSLFDDPFAFPNLGSDDGSDPDATPMTLADLADSFAFDNPADMLESSPADEPPADDGFGMPSSFFDDEPDDAPESESETRAPLPSSSAAPADPADNRLGRWKPIPKGGRH